MQRYNTFHQIEDAESRTAWGTGHNDYLEKGFSCHLTQYLSEFYLALQLDIVGALAGNDCCTKCPPHLMAREAGHLSN